MHNLVTTVHFALKTSCAVLAFRDERDGNEITHIVFMFAVLVFGLAPKGFLSVLIPAAAPTKRDD